jgi:hypothetical protein
MASKSVSSMRGEFFVEPSGWSEVWNELLRDLLIGGTTTDTELARDANGVVSGDGVLKVMVMEPPYAGCKSG